MHPIVVEAMARARSEQLLREARQQRLARQVPRPTPRWRQGLAALAVRAATRLDAGVGRATERIA